MGSRREGTGTGTGTGKAMDPPPNTPVTRMMMTMRGMKEVQTVRIDITMMTRKMTMMKETKALVWTQ